MATKKSRAQKKTNVQKKVSDKSNQAKRRGVKPPKKSNIKEEIQERSTKVKEYKDYCEDLRLDYSRKHNEVHAYVQIILDIREKVEHLIAECRGKSKKSRDYLLLIINKLYDEEYNIKGKKKTELDRMRQEQGDWINETTERLGDLNKEIRTVRVSNPEKYLINEDLINKLNSTQVGGSNAAAAAGGNNEGDGFVMVKNEALAQGNLPLMGENPEVVESIFGNNNVAEAQEGKAATGAAGNNNNEILNYGVANAAGNNAGGAEANAAGGNNAGGGGNNAGTSGNNSGVANAGGNNAGNNNNEILNVGVANAAGNNAGGAEANAAGGNNAGANAGGNNNNSLNELNLNNLPPGPDTVGVLLENYVDYCELLYEYYVVKHGEVEELHNMIMQIDDLIKRLIRRINEELQKDTDKYDELIEFVRNNIPEEQNIIDQLNEELNTMYDEQTRLLSDASASRNNITRRIDAFNYNPNKYIAASKDYSTRTTLGSSGSRSYFKSGSSSSSNPSRGYRSSAFNEFNSLVLRPPPPRPPNMKARALLPRTQQQLRGSLSSTNYQNNPNQSQSSDSLYLARQGAVANPVYVQNQYGVAQQFPAGRNDSRHYNYGDYNYGDYIRENYMTPSTSSSQRHSNSVYSPLRDEDEERRYESMNSPKGDRDRVAPKPYAVPYVSQSYAQPNPNLYVNNRYDHLRLPGTRKGTSKSKRSNILGTQRRKPTAKKPTPNEKKEATQKKQSKKKTQIRAKEEKAKNQFTAQENLQVGGAKKRGVLQFCCKQLKKNKYKGKNKKNLLLKKGQWVGTIKPYRGKRLTLKTNNKNKKISKLKKLQGQEVFYEEDKYRDENGNPYAVNVQKIVEESRNIEWPALNNRPTKKKGPSEYMKTKKYTKRAPGTTRIGTSKV